VISIAPARQLDAVAHDVVLERLDRQRIHRVERVQPALRHREGVVAERHLSRFGIPLVEGKIGNPAELVGVRFHQIELARQVPAQPVDRCRHFLAGLRNKKDGIAGLRANPRDERRAPIVVQKFGQRALDRLREYEIRDTSKAEALTGLDGLVEKASGPLGSAGRDDGAHHVAGRNSLGKTPRSPTHETNR
jgi:hypothetical protein